MYSRIKTCKKRHFVSTSQGIAGRMPAFHYVTQFGGPGTKRARVSVTLHLACPTFCPTLTKDNIFVMAVLAPSVWERSTDGISKADNTMPFFELCIYNIVLMQEGYLPAINERAFAE